MISVYGATAICYPQDVHSVEVNPGKWTGSEIMSAHDVVILCQSWELSLVVVTCRLCCYDGEVECTIGNDCMSVCTCSYHLGFDFLISCCSSLSPEIGLVCPLHNPWVLVHGFSSYQEIYDLLWQTPQTALVPWMVYGPGYTGRHRHL